MKCGPRTTPIGVALIAAILFTTACSGAQAVSATDDTPVATVAPTPAPTPVEVVEDVAVSPFAVVESDAEFPRPRYDSPTIVRSAPHEAEGIAAGSSVSDDAIVAVFGYSNTRDTFRGYERLVEPDFLYVSAAANSMDIERWATRPDAVPEALQRMEDSLGLPQSEITDRVEVVFFQVALAGTSEPRVDEARKLLRDAIDAISVPFPNLKQVYLLGREYGGWSEKVAADGTSRNGEPGNWSISIAIDRVVNDNHGRGDGLWIGHGPYLWANGDTPRADGLTWPRSDFRDDGIHMLPPGIEKAALLIHAHFLNDPTAPWYEASLAVRE